MSILKEYLTLRNELVTMLQNMTNVEQPLSTFVVQPIFKSMIESLAREILCNGYGGFVVTME
jgi:hypothetical protein